MTVVVRLQAAIAYLVANMKTRDITIAGILIALQVITLLLIYVIPTIKLALLFAVSLYSGILLRVGVKRITIFLSYIATAALILILINIVDITALFIVFFGWYSLLHEGTRKVSSIKKQIVRWVGFIASFAILYFAFTLLITFEIAYALWIYALAGVVAFIALQILYEMCVKEFIRMSGIRYEKGVIIFRK